jgi:U32 family peptidase
MRRVVQIMNRAQAVLLTSEIVDEAILCTCELSKIGELSLVEAQELASELYKKGIQPILEWDILETESDFLRTCKRVLDLDLSLFRALRVQDVGAYFFALNKLSIPLHFIAENGNHNTRGLLEYARAGQHKLERIVLSLELPQEKIGEVTKALSGLNVKVELLALGQILLFYTPRKLLNMHFNDEFSGEQIYSLATSEESPHSGFPVVENRHGTFMFNTKDIGLFDQAPLLSDLGVYALRFDMRFLPSPLLAIKLTENLAGLYENFSQEKASEIKELYPKKLIRGFFQTNRSDRLFPKLKNQKLDAVRSHAFAEVIDGVKGSYALVQVKKTGATLELGDFLNFVTPEGKERSVELKNLWSTTGEPISSLDYGQMGLIPWVSSLVRRTLILKADRVDSGRDSTIS